MDLYSHQVLLLKPVSNGKSNHNNPQQPIVVWGDINKTTKLCLLLHSKYDYYFLVMTSHIVEISHS